jgi:hypothetical protein
MHCVTYNWKGNFSAVIQSYFRLNLIASFNIIDSFLQIRSILVSFLLHVLQLRAGDMKILCFYSILLENKSSLFKYVFQVNFISSFPSTIMPSDNSMSLYLTTSCSWIYILLSYPQSELMLSHSVDWLNWITSTMLIYREENFSDWYWSFFLHFLAQSSPLITQSVFIIKLPTLESISSILAQSELMLAQSLYWLDYIYNDDISRGDFFRWILDIHYSFVNNICPPRG